jgi:hypothetical protein
MHPHSSRCTHHVHSLVAGLLDPSDSKVIRYRLNTSDSKVTVYSRAGETLYGRVSKLSTNFEEILSRAYGNF